MCIMEVHAGAAKATMSQAVWHNTMTVVNDCKMIAQIMESRGDEASAAEAMTICEELERAAQQAMELFRRHVDDVRVSELSAVDSHGNERTEEDIARHAAHDAEPDYARPNEQDRGPWQGGHVPHFGD